MGWLVAYDISSPKRWRKVYSRIGEVGYRLQYSLFWLPCDGRTGNALADSLAEIIDPGEDDLRFYRFPDTAWARLYGPLPWSEGVDDALTRRFGDCWRASPDED